ncbi:carbonic anhydrase [Arachidicoccus rhizosphaerae]|uniref:Carbonic anhydrase n=1 Tax=Arachidicoccus rhizosphaerae TaxID=551991 RepID=A0A1H4AMH3_9BACT|nr:carbonic anhydrase family protein [Arachidicoccus rhizosphaerae]SEA36978.1 carbonic anhydrase [Arachidicoccus rhizosphaerae]
MKKAVLFLAISLALFSCNEQPEGGNSSADTSNTEVSQPALRTKVLTAAQQQALTPDQVINELKEGNKRFIRNDLTKRDHSAMVRDAAKGQFPKAVILSCLDSRIPVEDVFDRGIGDIFVARVAGNFSNTDIIGSLEFGCKVSGAKVILVLGHEACGAVKGAIDNVELGNITPMLAHIKPAIDSVKNFSGERTSKDDAFVEAVAKENVLNTIDNIRSHSPILKEMEAKGEIKIIGGYYNLHTGAVEFL